LSKPTPTIAGYCTGKIRIGVGLNATGVGAGELAAGVGAGLEDAELVSGVGAGDDDALVSGFGAGEAELVSGVGGAVATVVCLQLVSTSATTQRIKASLKECFLSIDITNLLGSSHRFIDRKS